MRPSIFAKVIGQKLAREYLFAMMGDETRFWIAQEVAETKYQHDAKKICKDCQRIDRKETINLHNRRIILLQ